MSSLSNKRNHNSRYKSNTKAKDQILKKITLTDLCPEEKGKIGQLILLIEKHRQQNDVLSKQNSQLQSSNQQLNQKVLRLEFESGKQESKVKELCKLLDQLRQHINIKQQQFKKFQQRVNRTLVDGQVQVQIIQKVQQPCSISKRLNHVDIKIQTEESPLERKQKRSKKTSKAYQKIMTGIASIGKAVDQKLSKKSYQSVQSNTSQLQDQQDFSNLARLWLKIKKQNQSQKQSSMHRPYKSIDSVYEKDYSQLIDHYKKLKASDPLNSNEDDIDQNDLNLMLKKRDFRANEVLRSTGTRQRQKEQLGYH